MMLKKLSTFMAATLMTVSLAGCGLFSSSSTHEPVDLDEFTASVATKTVWTANVGDSEGYMVPAVTDNAVYAAGDDRLYRLNRDNGDKVWSVDLKGQVTAGVGTDGNTVAVVSAGGQLEVFNQEGKPVWNKKLTADATIPPLVGNGLVVVTSADARTSAFDLSSGAPLWSYQSQAPALTLQTFRQMVWSPAGILVGQANGRLLALSPRGEVVFDAVISESHGITEVERLVDIVGRPWIDQQMMCAAAFQGSLVCMNAQNGQVLWHQKVDAVSGVISDPQKMYLVDSKGILHAYNRENGNEVWTRDNLLYRNPSAPVVVGNTIATGDYDGYVSFFSPADGKTVSRLHLDGAVKAPATPLAFGAVFQTVEGEVAYVVQDSLMK